MTPQLSNQTFFLARLILHIKQAENYATVISNERTVTHGARYALKRIASRCKCAIGDFTKLMTPESLLIVQEELLPDDCAGQFENIGNLFLQLSLETRNEVEAELERLVAESRAAIA